MVNITLWPLYPRERTPVHVEEEAGWASEAIWTFGEEKRVLHLPGFEPPMVQSVA
jgi:hypothetical protein